MSRPTTRKGRLLASLRCAYNRAIRAEENAPDERAAWKLATKSEAALQALRAVEAGRPIPAPRVIMTARVKARLGLEALATIGRVIARAVTCAASLAKARAAAVIARAARAVRKATRAALRRFLGRVIAIAMLLTLTAAMPRQKDTIMECTTASGATVEIESTLVLSTGHVTKETAELLNATVMTVPWAPQFWWDYGWIFWAKQDMELVDYPAEFAAIFKLALSLDCTWVRFDGDGPRIKGLPFYDW